MCKNSGKIFAAEPPSLEEIKLRRQNSPRTRKLKHFFALSNDPGKVDSNFFCYAATVLSPHRNVLIFTQRMHKRT